MRLDRPLLALLAVVLASVAPAGESDAILPVAEIQPRMNAATVKAMIEVIEKETGSADRSRAAVALGLARVATPEALKALESLLSEEHPPARASAVAALGRSRAPAAAAAILSRLTDPDESVRIAACAAVAELGRKENAGGLPFADAAPAVRLAAVGAAARLGGGTAAKLAARFGAEEDPGIRAAILRALGGAKEGLEPARRGIADKDPEVRAEALAWATALPAVAAPLREAALAALADPHCLPRRAACAAAAALAGAAADEALRPLLADPDPTVRVAAAAGLGEAGGAGCRPALVALQDDPLREIRRAGSAALVRHAHREAGEGKAIEALALAAVRSGRVPARREGLWMLGELPSGAGFPEILAFSLRTFAKAEEGKPAPAIPDTVESCLVLRAAVTTAHAPAAEIAMRSFEQELEPALRVHAARLLGTIKHAPALGMFCAKAKDYKVVNGVPIYTLTGRPRAVAIEAIAEIGGAEAWSTLVEVILTQKPAETPENVRLICARLVAAGRKEAAGPLTQALAELQKTEQGAVFADTVGKLTGKKPEFTPPAPPSQDGFFFLQVREP